MKFQYHFSLVLIILFFSYSGTAFAQKIYIPSAEKYVPIDYKDDVKIDLSQYSGNYVYVYPGYDEYEQFEGKPYIFTITIKSNKTGSEISASHTRQYAIDDPIKSVPLSNPSIVGSAFYSDEISGKFVTVKYKKKGIQYSKSGLFRKHRHDTGYDFYEKQ